ncbi:P-loop containing nucleoside triphosphate hydrolase protein [Mycena leptocephala]|nr:P-loop containing nucleoside triphosphate hydrolase protein [Mycena leptocephala]
MPALSLLLAIFFLCGTICVDGFTFHSPKGFDLVRKILLEALPTFEPHTYQMDGICKVLDGIDLVAVTPTGSGKTSFFFLTILVMIAIAANPSLCPGVTFPKDPVIVVLISKGFQDLLKFEPFYDRVYVLGVDEIHLLSLWGLAFRKAFTQIGFMRARFRAGIPIIGVTATLLSDPKVSDAIFDFLGVNRGEFYLLRRSNARHDIQILFRTLYSGIDGLYFPELAWVLRNNDKTIIFAATISLVFRIKIYLDSLLSNNVDRSLRVRTYHSINWPDENLETLELFKSNPLCQVIVSTNGLAQGNDINVVKTVVQFGEPESADMFVQKPGRARPNVSNPRAIFYISGLRTAKALKIVSQSDAENAADAKKDGTVAMDRPVAEIIAAHCKPFVQDRLYGNPTTDVPCTCHTCTKFPPAPRPADCRCSDCLPEDSAEVYVPKAKDKKPPSTIPQAQRLTKPMKEVGTARLEEFRLAVWFEAPDQATGLTPLAEFLPDDIIRLILDRILRAWQINILLCAA